MKSDYKLHMLTGKKPNRNELFERAKWDHMINYVSPQMVFI